MAAKNIDKGNINSLNFFKKQVHFREAFSGFRIQKQSTINKLYKSVLTLTKSNDTCKLFETTFSIYRLTQLTFTYSMETIGTLEKGKK